ncbi:MULTISPECIES: type ISP restriction/modification enzyme [unclassified Sulfitobacter]|uniref:DEAD/DEAH box helicase n=1 Tax=unclassified Sulfitobacter TaxID=196795 RepID=UPI0023E34937|nr:MULTISPECIES: type ISP restriction/modification enzyme [unclassified Sulfitobacter]MDF3383412.1 DEAD/DEAH box helicase [Sulfitobacter sp. Ks11]MDF3386830.1 DEAD/DEAH box helicase [Sulfitobacter sp. M85]MDF3390250.1 DEAD/DEAH box helicase [Sulfitobacter sp. Ks16]MDF3400887.1 DEAD/DEAH box helicase [Sulfitobacter sp. KE39]MDF3404308.1 DEAD/DEAH box helicase [Sulfitobacter sp. Ks35]
MSALDTLLQSYRDAAVTEREKGTYFERLACAYLTADPVQAEEYSQVWTWSDWAIETGRNAKDIGIDLVAKLRNEDGFAAIQCKFYSAAHRIQKADINSFIAASGKSPFVRRIVMDTTEVEWGANAEATIVDQAIPVVRLSLTHLRESPIDWALFGIKGEAVLTDKKALRPHQVEALEAVRAGLSEADRGKLIMACGTGKTFTSLKIAEALVGKGGRVLFMVPSLALMSQTVREWTNDTEIPLRSFAVCSDAQVGKRRVSNDDAAEIEAHDLAFPATTNPERLVQKAGHDDSERMTVVFSTYQSIAVLDAAQKAGLPAFDLIICDEAHRTTGATLAGEEESNFVRIHDNAYVKGRKRLYMTATPRIFGDVAKTRADEEAAVLASMDDESLYGQTFLHKGFGWAVQQGLLTDYKVIVLAMDEGLVSASVQKRLADENSELDLDDATKIIGCYKALTKQDLQQDVSFDPQPMKRGLAFCKSIAASKLIRDEFANVVAEYTGDDAMIEDDAPSSPDRLDIEIEHVDGTFNAKSRNQLLDWLKADAEGNTARILTNARCLSEGVDVPSLDAIMFLHPRKSLIDVVQSVGRVMRRAEGKKMGYVILPVGVPAGVEPEVALKDNERYRVVWQILNALRAHDERFDGTINQASLGQDVSDRIEIVGVTKESEELKSITHEVTELPTRKAQPQAGLGKGSDTGDIVIESPSAQQYELFIDEFSKAIMAKIVKKCGTRDYWEDWATNIAEIAQRHISRITGILAEPDTKARKAFDDFLAELRDDLNDSITEQDAIEMLAQHLITRPVFKALFAGHQFTDQNPVSRAMQQVLDVLDENRIDKEAKDLEKFYDSVRNRAHGISDPQAKQRLIVELYDKFFRNAFPRTTEKLGIVYTPVEIVDFILHSVNEMLQEHFGQSLGSKGVHIMDPFTGTGTFITRLLQSGLIAPEELEHKYRHEIHANEIVLLAYYIAAINIEAVYQGEAKKNEYVPFEGICLTDTFQLYEGKDELALYMPDNSERRTRQKELDIRVIVGNPPYSASQNSANDNNANVAYSGLDTRIRDTFAERSNAGMKNALYDSYIRAIRWASDRIGNAGIVAYVTNAGWLEGNAADGVRACLAEEFSDLYVFHLRGNARTSGEQRRKEKGNVFGEGTRTPVAISVFVKNPNAAEHGRIFFQDIGDYLDQKQKLAIIRNFGAVKGITDSVGWERITPDDQNDWLNQRDASFDAFIKIGDKKDKSAKHLFSDYSSGLKTNRDSWCFNFNKERLLGNIAGSISFYNDEVKRYSVAADGQSAKEFVDQDATKISWDRTELSGVERGRYIEFKKSAAFPATYRPFTRTWAYFDRRFNNCVYRMPKLFPTPYTKTRTIALTGGSAPQFSCYMTETLPEFLTMFNGQCFPLHLYDQQDEETGGLFEGQSSGLHRRDAITDAGLTHFQAAYPGQEITKEEIFYYVYGLLHSPDYRDRYADNLTKELPRIPAVKTYADFRAFSDAGRRLGDLHVNYETIEPYPVTYKQGTPALWKIDDPKAFYRVTKMKFGGKARDKDKTTVIYNANITMTDVPLEAYDYVVNGKPALEWVMERQVVKTDKASGIVNDANDYANETMGDPAYPLDLFRRVITVSLETMKIVNGLPKLDLPA